MHFDNRFLIFSLAEELYAIELRSLKEILPRQEIINVPFTPPDLLGVVNVRGQVVSIVELSTRFGLSPAAQTSESTILILEHEKELMGLCVDRIDWVAQILPEQLERPPNFANVALNKHAQAVTRIERQLIVVLGTEKLFSFEETFGSEAEGLTATVS